MVIIKGASKEGHDLSVSLNPDSHSIRRPLVAGPEHRQADRGHAPMLLVLTLSPLAQEKAALLGGNMRAWALERPVSTKARSAVFAAYHGRFQRYRYLFVAGACLGPVGEERPVVRLAGAEA